MLSVGASLSAMSLIDSLGHVPEEFCRLGPQRPLIIADLKDHSDFELLKSHGGSSSMSKNHMHCHISLILGTYSLLLQIALLAWIKSGSNVVFAFVSLCLFWVCLLYPGQLILAFLRGIVESYRGSGLRSEEDS